MRRMTLICGMLCAVVTYAAPENMATPKLGEINLIHSVDDLETSVDFYTRLGFERHNEGEWSAQHAILRYDTFVLVLMQDVIPQRAMLHFVVDDQDAVEAAVADLATRGITMDPAGPGDTQAYIEDPDGHAIYLSRP